MFTKIWIGCITFLSIVIIGLLISLVKLEDDLQEAKQEVATAQQNEARALIDSIKKTNELNKKIVEVVEVPNTVYVEKKIYEKPKIEYVTKEIERLVMLPSYSTLCFDVNGLRQVNSLITRTYNDPTITSKPSK